MKDMWAITFTVIFHLVQIAFAPRLADLRVLFTMCVMSAILRGRAWDKENEMKTSVASRESRCIAYF